MGVMRNLVGLMAFAALAACEQKAVNTTIDPPTSPQPPVDAAAVTRAGNEPGVEQASGVRSAEPGIRQPAAGSSERKAVLDALRPGIERTYEAPVTFYSVSINIGGRYAFVVAEPRRPDGRPVLVCGDGSPGQVPCPLIEALLEQDSNSRWRVIEWNDGPFGGDDEFCARYPRGLMPAYCP